MIRAAQAPKTLHSSLIQNLPSFRKSLGAAHAIAIPWILGMVCNDYYIENAKDLKDDLLGRFIKSFAQLDPYLPGTICTIVGASAWRNGYAIRSLVFGGLGILYTLLMPLKKHLLQLISKMAASDEELEKHSEEASKIHSWISLIEKTVILSGFAFAALSKGLCLTPPTSWIEKSEMSAEAFKFDKTGEKPSFGDLNKTWMNNLKTEINSFKLLMQNTKQLVPDLLSGFTKGTWASIQAKSKRLDAFQQKMTENSSSAVQAAYVLTFLGRFLPAALFAYQGLTYGRESLAGHSFFAQSHQQTHPELEKWQKFLLNLSLFASAIAALGTKYEHWNPVAMNIFKGSAWPGFIGLVLNNLNLGTTSRLAGLTFTKTLLATQMTGFAVSLVKFE
ncbi:MAG: hypothetical protein SFU25_08165 [Candidatus Caenarcaniphilales bacterium]|nr:hypothetical protein [Candidatus Caenarcaniphilales bacterium]